jgi:hypothetical protein
LLKHREARLLRNLPLLGSLNPEVALPIRISMLALAVLRI